MGQNSKPNLSVRKTLSRKKKRPLKNLWQSEKESLKEPKVDVKVKRLENELCGIKKRKEDAGLELALVMEEVKQREAMLAQCRTESMKLKNTIAKERNYLSRMKTECQSIKIYNKYCNMKTKRLQIENSVIENQCKIVTDTSRKWKDHLTILREQNENKENMVEKCRKQMRSMDGKLVLPGAKTRMKG